MENLKASASAANPLFESYAEIARSLVPDLTGVSLFDSALKPRGLTPGVRVEGLRRHLRKRYGNGGDVRRPCAAQIDTKTAVIIIPFASDDNELLGVLCVQQPRSGDRTQAARHAEDMLRKLKPLTDCIHRELLTQRPVPSRVQTLTERTAELEWLFKVSSGLKGSIDDRRVVEELLTAATERMGGGYGAIWIPAKRLCIESVRDAQQADLLRNAFHQTRQALLTWVERQNRPFAVNGAGSAGTAVVRCKILAVPVVRESGATSGLLALYSPPNALNFGSRHIFLARHLGRQIGSVVDAQFDLMTGLYTRSGLHRMYGSWDDPSLGDRTIVYIDVDHMHVVNELLGFELGNELIVRIADLLEPPSLPEGAIAARIAADRFVVVLPGSEIKEATDIANRLRTAARELTIGPPEKSTEISISCGVAHLMCMPQGLDRGIAAAELACKTAKNRGRDRVEVYAFDDNTMMRSHGDAIAIGQLRAALKTDRLELFAQRITPLSNLNLPGGYEILLRMRDEEGGLVAPGPFIEAAARFQLLPTVDRWVTKRALEMLAPYRGVLISSGIGIAINVSGQSIGDESFVSQLAQLVEAAKLPQNCITIEITEQAAVTNLVKANEFIRQLKALGCQFALDDFGTGANSLTSLKQLQISKVKIDGSFVRDVATDRNSRATVRAIVELAEAMNINTVAEYVESNEIAEEVRRLGVDYAQGYAFGKPEPLGEILERLGADESQRIHRLFLES